MGRAILGAAALMLALASCGGGGVVQSACLKADRKAASRQLCGCVQRVADQRLRGGDQGRAAAFFKNPDKAQETRMSKRDRDNEFWARYKAFAEAAEAQCSAGG